MTEQNPQEPVGHRDAQESVERDDMLAKMTQAGEQAHAPDRGAPDSQYGTDSSSKTPTRESRVQPDSSSAPTSSGASESSTGADRDTLTGARGTGR